MGIAAENSKVRTGVLCALLAVAMAALFWIGEPANTALAWRRENLGQGQWWRLFTGNFVHFTAYHTSMNSAGLVLAGVFLLYQMSFRLLCWNLLLLPLFVGVGLWVLSPELDEYRGFSGVFYGTLTAGFLNLWYRDRFLCLAGLVFLGGKVLYEQLPLFDPMYMQSKIGVAVAAESHLSGVAGAFVFNLIYQLRYSAWRVNDAAGDDGPPPS